MNILKEGTVYTMGASSRIGDRSYIGKLWVVISQNATAVVITGFGKPKHDHDTWHTKKHIIDKSEYVFTDATALVPAVLSDILPAQSISQNNPEWVRSALAGRNIDAIKEIRDIAGFYEGEKLSLVQAKRIVESIKS